MSRQFTIGIIIAIAICGGLFFFLQDSSGKNDSDSAAGRQAVRDAAKFASSDLDPSAGDPVEAATEESIEPVDPESPPLLEGDVIGEGVGVPGATVLLFSASRVESVIRRAEEELSGLATGGIPDVSGILGYVRGELEAFRRSAIVTTTDENGHFEVRDIEVGGYFLLTLAPRWLFRYGDVVALAEDRTTSVTLDLERGASIAGRVVKPSGGGVAGVQVIAEFAPASTTGIGPLVRRALRYVNGEFLKGPFETTTASDGSFEIASLPPGNYNITAYDKKGLEGTLQGVITGTTGAVVLFGDPARIVGTLATPRGYPLANTPLRLERIDQVINLPFPGAADFIAMAERLLGVPPREATSDRMGRFAFGHLGAGRYRLSVETPGLNPFQQELRVDWGEQLDLGEVLIDPGQSIRGRVFSAATNRPIAGAKVDAMMNAGGMMSGGPMFRDLVSGRLSAVSDKDGNFEILGLRPATTYNVSASFQNFASETIRSVPVEGDPIDIALVPGETVTGMVVRSDTGEGVAGATVRAGSARTKSTASGEFTLEGVVAGSTSMAFMFGGPRAFRSDEEKSREASISARSRGFIDDEVVVDLDRGRDGVVLTIEPIVPITGVVLGPDGAPQPGALVRLTPAFPDDMGPFQFDSSLIFFAVVVTNADGEFTMDRYFADDNAEYEVIADFPGFTRGKSEQFDLETVPTISPVIVNLRAASTITGVVTDGSGPVPGAIVRLSKARDGGDPQEMMMMQLLGLPKGGEEVHTDQDGRFSYESHAPGEFEIGAEMVGYSDSPTQRFSIEEGQTLEFSLVLDPGSVLAGVVTDDFGTPVADAVVRVLEESGIDATIFDAQLALGGALRSTRTDENGNYQIIGLGAGGYAAVAEKRGFAKGVVQGIYVNGLASQNLVLVPSASLRAQVIDTANGRPISEFELYLSAREGGFDFGPDIEPISSPDGTFERNDLDPGKYDLKIRAAGFSSANLEVRLEPGLMQEQVIELERAASIVGRVIDAETGEPVQGAEVGRVLPGDDDDVDRATQRSFVRDLILSESVRTDKDGRFVLDTVPAGENMLVVKSKDYVQLKKSAPATRSGQETEVTLQLSRGQSIRGTVRLLGGASAGERFLILVGNDEATKGVRKTSMSDSDGSFEFSGLEAGEYRIRSNFGRNSPDELTIELGDNDLNGLTVTVADESP